MALGKKVAIFDWEWGRNSALREGQKNDCLIWVCTVCFVLVGRQLLFKISELLLYLFLLLLLNVWLVSSPELKAQVRYSRIS